MSPLARTSALVYVVVLLLLAGVGAQAQITYRGDCFEQTADGGLLLSLVWSGLVRPKL